MNLMIDDKEENNNVNNEEIVKEYAKVAKKIIEIAEDYLMYNNNLQ